MAFDSSRALRALGYRPSKANTPLQPLSTHTPFPWKPQLSP
jgi:hypothetical protein